MNNKEAIKVITQHIKDSLAEWSSILIEANNNDWLIELEFDLKDVDNIVHIFKSILVPYSVKHGIINEQNVGQKWDLFNKMMKDIFGLEYDETNT